MKYHQLALATHLTDIRGEWCACLVHQLNDVINISGQDGCRIALLKRLEGDSRINKLIDSEVKAGPGGGKGHLLLVMECGEIDLARLLQEQMKEPVNMVWVAYYWQQPEVTFFYPFQTSVTVTLFSQMLQAIHVCHS